jgi:predicted RNase H-like HicB family nuclease
MKHRLVFHRTDEGCAVEVPDLPGRWSQGATVAEAEANIRLAIGEYLAVAEQLQARGN